MRNRNRGCGDDILRYLDNLGNVYPIMKRWSIHPWRSILSMAKEGELRAIQGIHCICSCINQDGWQKIAEIAATNGHLRILEWIQRNANINWQSIGVIARDRGYDDIASFADGYDYVISADFSDETDDFPFQWGPTGDPMEDKGEWVFDWRMQDYDEEFLPEEPLISDTGEEQWETPEDYTPFTSENLGWGFRGDRLDMDLVLFSEFEDDEDLDRIADPYEDDIALS